MPLKRYELNGKESYYAITNFFTAHLTIDLYEPVDEAVMLFAVREAVKYHPLFGTRLIFDDGIFYLEENTEPPVIFRATRAPKIYGTAINNYYPWLLTVQDKQLVFNTMHYITDGLGMFNFCKTVLHIYFQRMGVVFKDNKTDFPDGTPEQTMENAALKYYDKDSVGVGTPDFDPPTLIDPELIDPDNNQPWRLIMPFSEIRALSKDSETSVFSVISCILSRAMAKAYDIKSGNIDVRVPVSLRGTFPTATDRNFVQGFSLCYMADRMNDMPDALVETAFRSQLDIWTEKGNLTEILNNDVAFVERLKSGPEEMQSILSFDQTDEPRANILYTHITRPGFSEELMEHVADMHLMSNQFQDDFVNVYGTTVRSDICLTIQQCSVNDCYMDALREVLDARGITYKLTQMDMAPEKICVDTAVLRNYKSIMKIHKMKYQIRLFDNYIKNKLNK